MSSNLAIDQQYREWLTTLKDKVRNAQIKAAVRVNTELLSRRLLPLKRSG